MVSDPLLIERVRYIGHGEISCCVSVAMVVVLGECSNETSPENQEAEPNQTEPQTDGSRPSHRSVWKSSDDEHEYPHRKDGEEDLHCADNIVHRTVSEQVFLWATTAKKSVAHNKRLSADGDGEAKTKEGDEKEGNYIWVEDEFGKHTYRKYEGGDNTNELAGLERFRPDELAGNVEPVNCIVKRIRLF